MSRRTYDRRRRPRLPDAVVLGYRAHLRRLLRAFQEHLLERALAKLPRQDKNHVLGEVELRLEEPAERGSRIEQWAERTDRFVKGEIKRTVGIAITKVDPKVAKMIPAWRKENVSLITSVQTDLHGEVEDVLADGMKRGLHSDEIRKTIQERFDVSRSRADLIARDQVLSLNAAITQTRHRAAGITRYRWSTSGDERVRQSHQDLDGLVFEYGEPPVSEDDGSKGEPGELWQCRCVAIPVLDELEEA